MEHPVIILFHHNQCHSPVAAIIIIDPARSIQKKE
jgi:hypothetical protein